MPKGLEYQVKVVHKVDLDDPELTPEEVLAAVVGKQAKHRWQVQAFTDGGPYWTVIFFRITRTKKEEFDF